MVDPDLVSNYDACWPASKPPTGDFNQDEWMACWGFPSALSNPLLVASAYWSAHWFLLAATRVPLPFWHFKALPNQLHSKSKKHECFSWWEKGSWTPSHSILDSSKGRFSFGLQAGANISAKGWLNFHCLFKLPFTHEKLSIHDSLEGTFHWVAAERCTDTLG